MAPWDENRYFQTPKFSNQSVFHLAVTEIAKANPNRVGLIILCPSPIATVTVFPTDSGYGSVTGWLMATPINELRFLQKDWGPLVAMSWSLFYSGAGSVSVQVVELMLSEWPKGVKENDQSGQ